MWLVGRGGVTPSGLAADGADIIGVDICADIPSNGYPMANRAELDETIALVEAMGGKMLGSVADVRDFARAERARSCDRSRSSSAVSTSSAPMPASRRMAFRELTIEEELEQWTDVLDVNLVGAFHTAKAAIPHLIAGQRGGSIVFTSSTAGLRGFGGLQGGGLALRRVQARHRRADADAGQCACPAEYPGQHRASDRGATR